MDFLYLLCEGEKVATVVSGSVGDDIFKWACGGMGLFILLMGKGMKVLYDDVKATPDKIKAAENLIRVKFEKVITDLKTDHKTELSDQRKETERHRDQKEKLVTDQLKDQKDEIKSFSEQSTAFRDMLDRDLIPVIKKNSGQLKENSTLLDYYRSRREKKP